MNLQLILEILLKFIRLKANDLTRDLKRRVFDTEGQIAKLKMKLIAS